MHAPNVLKGWAVGLAVPGLFFFLPHLRSTRISMSENSTSAGSSGSSRPSKAIISKR